MARGCLLKIKQKDSRNERRVPRTPAQGPWQPGELDMNRTLHPTFRDVEGGGVTFRQNQDSDNVICLHKGEWDLMMVMMTALYCANSTAGL
jgi:hypothetical protein